MCFKKLPDLEAVRYTALLFLFGLAMALGFIHWPKTKRFVGFAAVLVVDLGMTRLPSGLGGVIGTAPVEAGIRAPIRWAASDAGRRNFVAKCHVIPQAN